MRAVLFFVLGIAACASAASAQPVRGGYVQAIGGVGGAARNDVVVGGTGALRVHERFEVFGELGRFEDGIWDALDDELESAGDAIRSQIGTQFGTAVDVAFEARVPIWYGAAGVRFRGPRIKAFGTYLEAGAGMARLRPGVSLEIAGERLDAEARRLLSLDDPRAELLTLAGGGVNVLVLSRIRLEGGYRFSRVHGDLPVNITRVHGGVGFAF